MKEKNYNIEWIRAIACVMVIIIHVANYFCRAYGEITQAEYVFSVAWNVLARVSVPCFFMITGGLLLSRQDTMKQSLKRALKAFIVLVVWSGVFCLSNMFYTHQEILWKDLLKVPMEAHLWYLYALIPIYLMLPFLQTMCNHMGPQLEKAFLIIGAIWNVLLSVVTVFRLEFYYHFPILGEASYIYYMFLGHMIVKYKDRIPKKPKLWLGIYLGVSALNVLFTSLISFYVDRYFNYLFAYGFGFVMISAVAFYIYMMQRDFKSYGKALQSFCGCSFGIYVMHIVFLDFYKQNVLPEEFTAYLAIPLLIVGICLATWGSVWLMRKCKVGREIT